MNIEQVQFAVNTLARSQRGRNAMRRILAWLDDDGLGLDLDNQACVIEILDAAWDGLAGTARDLMRAVVEARCEHDIPDGDYCKQCAVEYKRARRESGDTEET